MEAMEESFSTKVNPQGKEGFITVNVTQYLRPNGRVRATTAQLPKRCQTAYEDMTRMGYRFTSEVLPTGEVSSTISDNAEDVDIIITPNDQNVQTALSLMLYRAKWNK